MIYIANIAGLILLTIFYNWWSDKATPRDDDGTPITALTPAYPMIVTLLIAVVFFGQFLFGGIS